jgi:prevent-host-death family protein
VVPDGNRRKHDTRHRGRLEAAAELIERVEHGEEIIISRAGQPVAKIIPLGRQARLASLGSLKGKLVLDDDWDSPETNEVIARDFGMYG